MKALELKALGETLNGMGLFSNKNYQTYIDCYLDDTPDGYCLHLPINNIYNGKIVNLGTVIFMEDDKTTIKDAYYILENRLKTISMTDLYNSINLPENMRGNPVIAREYVEACKNTVKGLIYTIQNQMKELVAKTEQRAADIDYSLTKDPSLPNVDVLTLKEYGDDVTATGEMHIGDTSEYFVAHIEREDNGKIKVDCERFVKEVLEK